MHKSKFSTRIDGLLQERNWTGACEEVKAVFKAADREEDYKKLLRTFSLRDQSAVVNDILAVLTDARDDFDAYNKFKPLNTLELQLGDSFNGPFSVTLRSFHAGEGIYEPLYGLEHSLVFPLGYDEGGYHDDACKDYLKQHPDEANYIEQVAAARKYKKEISVYFKYVHDKYEFLVDDETLPSREIFVYLALTVYCAYMSGLSEKLINDARFAALNKSLPFYFAVASRAINGSPDVAYDPFRGYEREYLIDKCDEQSLAGKDLEPIFLAAQPASDVSDEERFSYARQYLAKDEECIERQIIVDLINESAALRQRLLSEFNKVREMAMATNPEDFFEGSRARKTIRRLNREMQVLVGLSATGFRAELEAFFDRFFLIAVPELEADDLVLSFFNNVADRFEIYLRLTAGVYYQAIPPRLRPAYEERLHRAMDALYTRSDNPVLQVMEIELAHGTMPPAEATSQLGNSYADLVVALLKDFSARSSNGIEEELMTARVNALGVAVVYARDALLDFFMDANTPVQTLDKLVEFLIEFGEAPPPEYVVCLQLLSTPDSNIECWLEEHDIHVPTPEEQAEMLLAQKS